MSSEVLARSKARIGTVLSGKWHLDGLLGVGGTAAVYAATHRNQKRAAIKILHPELSKEPSFVKRFLREGYVANSVKHTGVVGVLDDDTAEDGSTYIVMELLEGYTLERRSGPDPRRSRPCLRWAPRGAQARAGRPGARAAAR